MSFRVAWRLVSTVLLFLLYAVGAAAWAGVESPLRGIANARTLNDSVSSWVSFQFVARNGVENFMPLALVACLGAIWLTLFIKPKSTPLHEK